MRYYDAMSATWGWNKLFLWIRMDIKSDLQVELKTWTSPSFTGRQKYIKKLYAKMLKKANICIEQIYKKRSVNSYFMWNIERDTRLPGEARKTRHLNMFLLENMNSHFLTSSGKYLFIYFSDIRARKHAINCDCGFYKRYQ